MREVGKVYTCKWSKKEVGKAKKLEKPNFLSKSAVFNH